MTPRPGVLPPGFELRDQPRPDDRPRVRQLLEATGFFSAAEVGIAVELVDDWLARGDASGYHFLLADRDGRPEGYSCFGPIPLTRGSFDLYWIAVHPDRQGSGLGRALLAESETRIRAAGGTRVYVDTSSRAQYTPTRAFYEACGYRPEAVLEDFYAPGDGKVIYAKVL